MAYEDNSFEDKSGRFVLMGTIHGAFSDCSNDIPGIYVEVDDSSVLDFLHKEVYGSGLFRNLFQIKQSFHSKSRMNKRIDMHLGPLLVGDQGNWSNPSIQYF